MTMTHKASVLHGAHDLRLEERALEGPGPKELQIIIRATILCGSDLHYYQHFRNGDFQVREPLSLGHESAGVVAAIGSEVGIWQDFKIGDHVALEVGLPCGDKEKCQMCGGGRYNICPELKFRSSAKGFPHFQGTLQERINHPAKWCHKLPDGFPFELGAILEPLSVAIHASRRANISPKVSGVLVLGAGAVGLLCAAMAKKEGLPVVIADIQQQRVSFAMENGFADHGFVVPIKPGHDIGEKLQIAKKTAQLAWQIRSSYESSEKGYNVVFECTGVEACTQAAIYATRPGGKVIIVGMGNPVQALPISAAALREVDILGTFRYADTYHEAIQLASKNDKHLPDLRKLVTHRYQGLANVESAFQMAGRTIDGNGALVLKVVVDLGGNEEASTAVDDVVP